MLDSHAFECGLESRQCSPYVHAYVCHIHKCIRRKKEGMDGEGRVEGGMEGGRGGEERGSLKIY